MIDGSRFVYPVRGGKTGRTDEGVDIAAPPGAAVVDPVPGVSQLFKVIPDWFRGQAFEAFRVISGPFKGKAWYGAEQITFKTQTPGAQFSQGQQIGTYAQSGTATEFGWADPATGEAAAHGHYTEGVPTAEGQDFAARVKGGTPPIVRPGGSSGGNGSGVGEVFSRYQDEVTMDRKAPSPSGPGWKTPFDWWWQSFSGKWAAEAQGSATQSATSGGTGSDSHGLVTTQLLQQIGQKRGWTGQQIDDWMNVIKAESNGTLTDTNPSSGAYGIAQGITGPTWYYQHGGNPNTVEGQLTAMANYMAQRYGTPSAAWAHEQSMHWY